MTEEEMAIELMLQKRRQGAFGAPPVEEAPVQGAFGPAWINGPNQFAVPEAEARSFTPSAGDDARVATTEGLKGYLGQALAEKLGRLAGGVMDYGPMPAKVATDIAAQPIRAGDAVAQAAIDPNLANVTNAGAQTAMAVGRPLAALGALGVGYGEALRRDAGLDLSSPAQAQKSNMYGLTPEQNAEYDRLNKKLSRKDYKSAAERRSLEDAAKGLRDLSNQAALADRAAETNAKTQLKVREGESQQDEYNRAVKNAEVARDEALARNRRFSDTETGKVWDKTGGLAPMAFGAGTGAATRLATGGGSFMKNYGLPAGLGTAAGAAAANLPLGYNAIMTEPDNPEKRAYEAYSRELPPTHPRKQEWTDYARGLDADNPIRRESAKEFYDPVKLAERAGIGGVEGLLGGMLGSDAVRIGSRIKSAVTGKPAAKAAEEAKPVTATEEKASAFKGPTNDNNAVVVEELKKAVEALPPPPKGEFKAGIRPETPAHGTVHELKKDSAIRDTAAQFLAKLDGKKLTPQTTQLVLSRLGITDAKEKQIRNLTRALNGDDTFRAQIEIEAKKIGRDRVSREGKAARDALGSKLKKSEE